jgi:fumarate reductase subunit C
MATRHTYVRPMDGWWRRDGYYLRYMAREATALFVAAYAIVLLAGLVCLAQGPAAWEAWRAALRSPGSIALHASIVAALIYHTVSWFRIMPKTLPRLAVAGRKIEPAAITIAGIVASAMFSLALFFLAARFAS